MLRHDYDRLLNEIRQTANGMNTLNDAYTLARVGFGASHLSLGEIERHLIAHHNHMVNMERAIVRLLQDAARRER
jgi:hypothetical protein